MTAMDDTCTVLYHYLRALPVKVSRSTVFRLLDTPVGNSLRGVSDALDALHIKNEVYQLPPSADYLSQLEAPFIAMLQVDKNPFCVVTKRSDSIVEIRSSEGRKRCLEVDNFLKKWTGTVLLGETTAETPCDAFYIWKNILHFFRKYKSLIAVFLILFLGFFLALRQTYSPILLAYSGVLSVGIFASLAILYKEQVNDRFLEKFCHIGKVADCNKVLHSQGTNIAGAGLGELSLLYFTTLSFFCTLCPKEFYGIAVLCCGVALCFTLYSVVYQIIVIRKGCMLCMLVNATVWASAVILYEGRHHPVFPLSLSASSIFVVIGCICLTAGISIKALYKDHKEKIVLQQRRAYLLTPAVFQRLLPLQTHVEKPIAAHAALQNPKEEGNRLTIVTNPNCGSCAKAHRYIKELSSAVPISMVLLTFPNDRLGKHVAQTVIAAYLCDGWQKAMSLLEEWYNERQISEMGRYPVTPEAQRIWREQQEYCLGQRIDRTPAFIAAGHYMPEVYSLQELRYVLT